MPVFDLAPGKNTQRGFWGTDFQLVDGYVHVKSTGTRFKNDWQLWADIWRWFTYYAFVRLHGFWARLTKPRGPRIWFAPYRPRPWYIIWAAMVWGGFEFAPTPERADAAFYFEDQTVAEPPAPRRAKAFNFGVGDVSKTNVARVMEEAFGYPLAIDPLTFVGEAVEKGEGNGLHDGRLVTAPLSPAPGKAYQRVINTEGADGMACDLRTACVGGEPVVVFVKQKPASARFSIQNTSVVVKTRASFLRRRNRATQALPRSHETRLGRTRRPARTFKWAALCSRCKQDRHRPRCRSELARPYQGDNAALRRATGNGQRLTATSPTTAMRSTSA
ncbi:MAG: hypothetical protein IPG56_20025 [Caulobacteraceae bacterium]|nr:hypothetical protein [Caulobacteraceae bacterium]